MGELEEQLSGWQRGKSEEKRRVKMETKAKKQKEERDSH